PRVDFTYFADNFRVPYGNLTREELISRVDEIFEEIAKTNPAAAVVACNTVTAQCIDFLRNKYGFPILGIQPAIKPAVESGGKCLVLATPSTVKSNAFKSLLEKYGGSKTRVVACDKLAYYIEQNILNLSKEGVESLLPKCAADTVVLGCTHYVLAEKIIQSFYNCPVFDGISGTADHLKEVLGIYDHSGQRAQKIAFSGGDSYKNRKVFNSILRSEEVLNP
ncbi:MAG: aspartate/glutamate racemase family protein, partial [Clostridia bacterium]|nr:aspartate/glutamate racemase family protein [Clostridia bacterium]